ncbi:MAG: hypothetical protein LBP67_04960 [Bacteroidales bacterium]|jgi:hypothetical protein|nr:hypothetical protein [Bacteroidales bacterium]
MDWTNIIAIVVSSGGISLLSTFLFFKQNKRLKNAEASTSEFETMKSQIELQGKQITDLYRLLGERDGVISALEAANKEQNIKYHEKKIIIIQAKGCKNKNECPVLAMQKKIEEENYERSRNENK